MIRTALRALGELLITAGLLLLLFVSWQLWWTDVEAAAERAAITDRLRDSWQQPEEAGGPVAAPAAPAAPADPEAEPPEVEAPPVGTPFGIVHVPRFGDDYAVPVHEGIGLSAVLNDGVLGHYPGSAMPGEIGNFAAAGHRVTYGRPLNQIAELQPGDAIVVETESSWYIYRMRDAQVVAPDRVDVVAPVPGQPEAQPTERLLTLTACHPMYSARERYVVHAVMESWQPKTAGEPTVLAAGGG